MSEPKSATDALALAAPADGWQGIAGLTEADIEKAAQALVDHDWKGTQPPFDRKPPHWRDEYMARVDVVLAALPAAPTGETGT